NTTDMEELHQKILEIQKFESLMGKKRFSNNDEQSVNELVNHLENLGFSVTKQNTPKKQEINATSNYKRKFRKGPSKKGNYFRKPSSSPWLQSSTHSPQSQSQSYPQSFSKPFHRHGYRPQYNNNNSWNSKGSQFRRQYDDSNSRRYDHR